MMLTTYLHMGHIMNYEQRNANHFYHITKRGSFCYPSTIYWT